MPELLDLLDAAAGNIALAAIILSSGLLVIVTTREAFEHESPQLVPGLMGAPATTVVKWKYLDDNAEKARRLLHLAAELLRIGMIVILGFVLLCLLAAALAGSARIVGEGTDQVAAIARGLHRAWTTWADYKTLANYLFKGGVIVLGPAIILILSMVVYRVVLFRRAYGA